MGTQARDVLLGDPQRRDEVPAVAVGAVGLDALLDGVVEGPTVERVVTGAPALVASFGRCSATENSRRARSSIRSIRLGISTSISTAWRWRRESDWSLVVDSKLTPSTKAQARSR